MIDLELTTKEIKEWLIPILDEVIEEVVAPIENLGNPEKLIGKPYEVWDEQDLQTLGQLAGPEPNWLSHFIFKKEYAKWKALERRA